MGRVADVIALGRAWIWLKGNAWLPLSRNTSTWSRVLSFDLCPRFYADSNGGQAGGFKDGISGLTEA
jgi:hypothetical protein